MECFSPYVYKINSLRNGIHCHIQVCFFHNWQLTMHHLCDTAATNHGVVAALSAFLQPVPPSYCSPATVTDIKCVYFVYLMFNENCIATVSVIEVCCIDYFDFSPCLMRMYIVTAVLFCFGKSMTEDLDRSCFRGEVSFIFQCIFLHSSTALVGLGLIIGDVSTSQSDAHTHSIELLWMSDQPDP
jgi:hypothetical protein